MRADSGTDANQGAQIAASALGASSAKGPRLACLVPLLFMALVVVLGVGLTLDPRKVPSPLIGKPVPEFSLPPVKGRTLGLASADLKGEVSLVNVFASWCVACRSEHPLFMKLKADGSVRSLPRSSKKKSCL